MCILCEAGSLGSLLAPVIGIGGAMAIIKLEDRLRKLWHGKGNRTCKACRAKTKKP